MILEAYGVRALRHSICVRSVPTISIIPTLDLQCNALALVFVLFKGLKLKAPSSALLHCCTAALCSFSPARAEVVAAGERLLPLGLLLLLLDLSNLRNGTR